MKLHSIVAALCWSAAVTAPPASAADPSASQPGGAVNQACAQDVKTLCPGVQPGEGHIKACLKANRAKVSDGCKKALKDARAEHKAAAK